MMGFPFIRARQAGCLSIWGLFLLAVVWLLPAVAEAQAAEKLAKNRFKNGAEVKGAFRSIIAPASDATVRILCDGEKVALGAIVGAEGWVLTKRSQLRGRIDCQLKDGRQLPARLIGMSGAYDLAMLKIEAEDELPVIPWNRRRDPAVGQWLVTPGIGDLPVAVGVVSVKPRRIPGQQGVLGIRMNDTDNGPRITYIYPNSGAEQAGIEVGDVIRNVAGNPVHHSSTVTIEVRRLAPGDYLTVRVLRDGEERQFHARLGASFDDFLPEQSVRRQMEGRLSIRRAGFPRVLQHDTVLKPEECGGPVVDLSGEVVGINIARAGRTESYAIPVDAILPLLDEMKSGRLAPPLVIQASLDEPAASSHSAMRQISP